MAPLSPFRLCVSKLLSPRSHGAYVGESAHGSPIPQHRQTPTPRAPVQSCHLVVSPFWSRAHAAVSRVGDRQGCWTEESCTWILIEWLVSGDRSDTITEIILKGGIFLFGLKVLWNLRVKGQQTLFIFPLTVWKTANVKGQRKWWGTKSRS
jgi:hypothetical protein